MALAQGSGPYHVKNNPKQFLDIIGRKSLLQFAVEHFLHIVSSADIFFVTQENKQFLIEREVAQYGLRKAQVICEPFMRGTVLCNSSWSFISLGRVGVRKNESICVPPSDQYIRDEGAFCSVLQKLENPPFGPYALLGVPPKNPNRGYGYIKKRNLLMENFSG